MLLGDVVSVLERLYDPAWAEPWDAVGLVCGDPEQPVRRVLLAVDPVAAVADEALEYGADLLVVHHPLFLTPVSSVAATTPKGRVLHRLLRGGVALYTAHTSADVPTGGVNDAIARRLGLTGTRVLLPTDDGAADRWDKLVVFAPLDAAERVRVAVTGAGAGRIGDYDSCTYTGPVGEGRFRPLPGADPAVGSLGELEVVEEVRMEAVVPRSRRREVLAALREAHPYEEPAFDLLELQGTRSSSRGHGRVGRLRAETTLEAFAAQVAQALPTTAHGVRVAGHRDRPVRTVAVGAGAGDSLLDLAARSDADVYVTSDLRHHPASELLEGGGPALVDVAHWAAEWSWLPVAERALREALAARAPAGAHRGEGDGEGDTVDTRVSTLVTDPWTFRA
jgi:dinuclear metal center YbgI/SA1388 family protein